jgi:hypothetical protein
MAKALEGFCPLVWRESSGTTETHATGLGALAAFSSTGADQLALEFGQATENREHQSAVWRCGVRPSIFQAAEAGFTLANRGQNVQ